MKILLSHLMRSSTGRTLGPKPSEYFIARNGLNSAAFKIVVAPVKRFPRSGDIVEEIGNHIFHQFVARTAAFAGHLVKLPLHLGFEMHFHAVSFFLSDYSKQKTGTSPPHVPQHDVTRRFHEEFRDEALPLGSRSLPLRSEYAVLAPIAPYPSIAANCACVSPALRRARAMASEARQKSACRGRL
jgi:hypothetical protein